MLVGGDSELDLNVASKITIDSAVERVGRGSFRKNAVEDISIENQNANMSDNAYLVSDWCEEKEEKSKKKDKDKETNKWPETEANDPKTTKFDVTDHEETIKSSESGEVVKEAPKTKLMGIQSSRPDEPRFDGDPNFAFGKNEKFVKIYDSVEKYGPWNYRGKQRRVLFDHGYIANTARQRHSTYLPTSSTLKGSKWLIKLTTLTCILWMWNFVAGNQCSSGTTISQVDEYRVINWNSPYIFSKFRSIYISPTSGATYLNAYVDSASDIDTAVIKLDSSGTKIYAKYYTTQQTVVDGFAVDNSETFMYLADSRIEGIQIVKANAVDGTIASVAEQ
jgi:hypothetical protein